MLTTRVLKAFALVLNLRAVAALTDCPTAVTYYTDGDGARYAICSGTDLQGTSAVITANIASTNDCAQLVRLPSWPTPLLSPPLVATDPPEEAQR
jgi:hypothetical protein